MSIADYTKKEVEYFLEECNFTEPQEVFFLLRSKDVSIEECAERMNISVSCANRISAKVRQKIDRVKI